MPTPAPYTRLLKDGVPYWKDTAGNLYYYESSALPTTDTRICLGTESSGLFPDWQTRLNSTLEAYRAEQTPRARAPPPAPKK